MTPEDRTSKIRKVLLDYDAIPYVIFQGYDALGINPIVFLVNNKAEWNKVGRKLGLDKAGLKSFVFEMEDNFFPHPLFERILKGRVRSLDLSIWIPNPNDRFVGILYDALYHFPDIPFDAQQILSIYRPTKYDATLNDRVAAHKYLCDQGYFPVRCSSPAMGHFIPEV